MDEYQALVVFEGKSIRRTWCNNEWWYSVIDIVGVLTRSERARKYWSDLKTKLSEEGYEVSAKIGQLKLVAEDGKLRPTDCINTKNAFRIIQSIPSPKAEPFKQWLAQVGYDRIQEIENPELAQIRMKELYKAKGYSDEWIETRIRGIVVRQDLTEEWKSRGVKQEQEFAILTNEISKATFDKTVEEYKEFKRLKKENLRDHMNSLELIFTMLGEASTAEIERVENPKGFNEHKTAAKEGGSVAKVARETLENKTKRKVISANNYLNKSEIERKRVDS